MNLKHDNTQVETGPTLVATSAQSQVNWGLECQWEQSLWLSDDLWAPWVLDLKLKVYFPCLCSAPAHTVHIMQLFCVHTSMCSPFFVSCMPWTCAWVTANAQEIWVLEGPLEHAHGHNAQVYFKGLNAQRCVRRNETWKIKYTCALRSKTLDAHKRLLKVRCCILFPCTSNSTSVITDSYLFARDRPLTVSGGGSHEPYCSHSQLCCISKCHLNSATFVGNKWPTISGGRSHELHCLFSHW